MTKTTKSRSDIRTDVRYNVLEWYTHHTGGRFPEHQCEDKQGERVLWWLEPLIPGIDNPVVVEDCPDGDWSIRVELRVSPIKVFVP